MTETHAQQFYRVLPVLGMAAALLLLTCATLHAQTVIVKGTGAGAVRGTGAGSVRGEVVYPTSTNYSDGRFTIFNTNQDVVLDNDSGLMWTRDANVGGTMDWANAITYCSNLTHATYSDWRLPSMTELSRDGTYGATNGLLDEYPSANEPALPLGHPFTSIQSGNYWSSTTYAGNTDRAWDVDLALGYVNASTKVTAYYVWPCRGP